MNNRREQSHRSGSARKSSRVRSRSANAVTENSEPRSRGMNHFADGAAAPSGHRVNRTAAHEIFNNPLDTHHNSVSLQGGQPYEGSRPNGFGSRRSSNNNVAGGSIDRQIMNNDTIVS